MYEEVGAPRPVFPTGVFLQQHEAKKGLATMQGDGSRGRRESCQSASPPSFYPLPSPFLAHAASGRVKP
eukprot:365973-Chlamydomonas_euryale.AAC.11